MMIPAKVAIHIVTHNSSQTIRDCLAAVENQTIPLEIAIWDNASSDDSVCMMRKLGYEVICCEENIGYSRAHNQLLHHTTAPLILTLNPDVMLMPDYLDYMVAVFEAHPRLGSAAGLLQRVEHLGVPTSVVDSAGLYLQPWYQQRLRYEKDNIHDVPCYITPIFGPDGAAAVYARVMLEDIAFEGEVFDCDFVIQKEDVDICWRSQFRGWTSLFVPDAQAQHIRSFRPGERQRVSKQLRFYSVRNRYLLLFKHSRWQLLKHHLWMIILYEIGILLYLLIYEQESLTGYVAALRLYPEMLAKRRYIHQNQCVCDTALKAWFQDDFAHKTTK